MENGDWTVVLRDAARQEVMRRRITTQEIPMGICSYMGRYFIYERMDTISQTINFGESSVTDFVP